MLARTGVLLATLLVACSLSDTPLFPAIAPRGDAGPAGDGDADADADADADGDADGDGDGDGDADPPCVDGAQQPCGTDVGECRVGRQTCRGGAWSACEGATVPQPERCDGPDQDCDGELDPEDGDADGDCGAGGFCTRRSGRSLCAYYAFCIGNDCCDSVDFACRADDLCERPSDDCDVCGFGCFCSVCYEL